ncbi:MAG: TM2 domain-containing protein [Gammaproteobacteria bacterium]|nr:TM2 domain-containing protein [Gammaproteobacteria bacterium]
MDSYAIEKINVMKKNAAVAYILWFILGSLGLHRFYMRKPLGWLYILLLILGFATAMFGIGFVFFLIVGIWCVVDAFLIYRWVERYNLNLLSSLEREKIVDEGRAAKPPVVEEKEKLVPKPEQQKKQGQEDSSGAAPEKDKP